MLRMEKSTAYSDQHLAGNDRSTFTDLEGHLAQKAGGHAKPPWLQRGVRGKGINAGDGVHTMSDCICDVISQRSAGRASWIDSSGRRKSSGLTSDSQVDDESMPEVTLDGQNGIAQQDRRRRYSREDRADEGREHDT